MDYMRIIGFAGTRKSHKDCLGTALQKEITALEDPLGSKLS